MGTVVTYQMVVLQQLMAAKKDEVVVAKDICSK